MNRNNLKLTFSSNLKNSRVSLGVYFYIRCLLIFNLAGVFFHFDWNYEINISKTTNKCIFCTTKQLHLQLHSCNVVVNRNIVHYNRTIPPNCAAQIQSDAFRRPFSGCAEHHTGVNRGKQALVATVTTTAWLKLSSKLLIGVNATSSKMPKLNFSRGKVLVKHHGHSIRQCAGMKAH